MMLWRVTNTNDKIRIPTVTSHITTNKSTNTNVKHTSVNTAVKNTTTKTILTSYMNATISMNRPPSTIQNDMTDNKDDHLDHIPWLLNEITNKQADSNHSIFTFLSETRTIYNTPFECVTINSNQSRFGYQSKYYQRSNIIYDRKRECTDKTIHPPSELFAKFDNPNIIWEWLSPEYENKTHNGNVNGDVNHDNSIDYSIIFTAFDTTNVFDIAVLLSLIFSRGNYELVVVFDAFDDESIVYLLNLIKTWIYHYIHNSKYIDCTDASIKSDYKYNNINSKNNYQFNKNDLFSKNVTIFSQAINYHLHNFYKTQKLTDFFKKQSSMPYKYCYESNIHTTNTDTANNNSNKHENKNKNNTETNHDHVDGVDNTINSGINWVNSCGNLLRVILLQVDGVWETSSNNLGMCISDPSTKYYIHIQDDMLMTQYGFNIHWSLPMIIFPNLMWAISGRQCHGLIQCATKIHAKLRQHPNATSMIKKIRDEYRANIAGHDYTEGDRIGRTGTSIDKALPFGVNTNVVHMRDACNRGPFVFSKKDIWKLNLFDEENFHLILDDCELCLRELNYEDVNMVKYVGYLPLQFASKLSWGATRRKRREKSQYEDDLRSEFNKWRNKRENKKSTFDHKYFLNLKEILTISHKDFGAADKKYDLCYYPK